MRVLRSKRFRLAPAGAVLCAMASGVAWAQQAEPQTAPQTGGNAEVVVTARRVEEKLQEVPIPVSVVSGALLEDAGAFNVNRLKELIPTVQFYSSNPRNSSINIRGLGAPFGLINDGIEPGVGLYVDGVYFARSASATLDFLDVERIEVLRGPQGTLFGKNTTAGAINVTTRAPSFAPESRIELSFGNLGFVQAKGSVTGPITDTFAARISLSATQRDGVLYNTKTQDDLNDLNNLGIRGQLLFKPSDTFKASLAADFTRQRPEGYAQVVAGVAPTQRAANRQYAAIAADLGYTPPSFDAFDRLSDADTPHRSYQDLGGVSLSADWDVGPGTLTSVTAWRYWDWQPSNDRDFIGLPVTTISANPSKSGQYSQELRYAGEFTDSLSFVVGAFAFTQSVKTSGTQEQGNAAYRFLLAPNANASTPGLLDGYGQKVNIKSSFTSAALFGQLEWSATDKLRILPGLRFNYDDKEGSYETTVYGGLQTTNAALVTLQRSVLAPQKYDVAADDSNVSGQLTVAYQATPRINAYATYATGFKSVGLNINGLPTDAAGVPVLSTATIKPEDVKHFEFGVKTQPFRNLTANVTLFQTDVNDYQVSVVNGQVGVLRGYLANAEQVRVRGVELDSDWRVNEKFKLYTAWAYTDGKYVSFPDAPPPLEETGGPQAKDISGSRLPGISEWAGTVGGEYTQPGGFLGREGDYFFGVDASYRSDFSSSPSESQYLVVDAYSLVNARLGFRAGDNWEVFAWGRNLLDEEYYEFLSAAPGNSGLYVGAVGDPRTYGITLRGSF